MQNDFWLFLFLMAVFTIGPDRSNRYQVSNCGNNQAIIVDTTTGEAWTTRQYADGTKRNSLIPVDYLTSQLYETYTAEETRNQKNCSWWTRLTKKPRV